MGKIGRNELCPCGSGKKFKHCCLDNEKKVSYEEKVDSYFLETHQLLNLIKDIPSVQEEIEYVPADNQREIKDLIQKYFDTPLFKESPKLNQLQLFRLKKRCEQQLLHKPKEFLLRIMHQEQYKNVMSKRKDIACYIYWNEIDQYIFYFRIKIIDLIRETILRLLKTEDDYVVAFFMLRQLIEFTCHAISCQWLLSTCYNIIKRTLSKKIGPKKPGFIGSGELEQFAIGLCFWEKKQLRKLGDILGKKFDQEKEYFSQEYDPSTKRLIETTIWVAENFDQAGWVKHKDLKIKIEKLGEYYKFLCKFIHPTPMLFKIDELNMGKDQAYPTNQDVINSSKIVFIEVFDRCTALLDNLFINKRFLELSFSELIIPSTSKSSVMTMIPIKLISQFVNRYRGHIQIPLENGGTKEL